MIRSRNTKEKILFEGRALLQKHGYNGFSFQDIANIIEIKKPSLYDHYSSKEDLIVAILEKYGDQFDTWSQKIEDHSPLDKLREVFKVFYAFSKDEKKICPVLALTTDMKTLSKPVQDAMKLFIDKWIAWLDLVIRQGQQSKMIRKNIEASSLSQLIYSQVMGAQLQARIKNSPAFILDAGETVIELISLD